MSAVVLLLTVAAALGAGAVSGVFFAYSTFTMSALRRLAPASGAAAMQSINREAPRPPLMALMFGTAAASLALGVVAALDLGEPSSVYLLLGAALYLIGVVAVTVAYHVPRNDRLGALDPDSAEGAAYWGVYLREWVRMNHVRTIASLVAAALYVIALQVG
jgi:uncharacterized membrane protein